MNLSPFEQDSVAAQIANSIHLTAPDHRAVATHVGHAGYPEAALVAITETGKTDCTAKVAVYRDRLVYVSHTGAHISRPARQEDAGRIVCGLLSVEGN